MKTHKFELTEEQIDKYGLRELIPFTGWAKSIIKSDWLGYYENNFLKYGITIFIDWFSASEKYPYDSKDKRPATPEEIEKMKMAKKMGFKEGVRFNTIETDIAICDDDAYVNKSGIFYLDNCVYTVNGVIYLDGKWATRIEQHKEMTIEEIQKELGYKIKIVE